MWGLGIAGNPQSNLESFWIAHNCSGKYEYLRGIAHACSSIVQFSENIWLKKKTWPWGLGVLKKKILRTSCRSNPMEFRGPFSSNPRDPRKGLGNSCFLWEILRKLVCRGTCVLLATKRLQGEFAVRTNVAPGFRPSPSGYCAPVEKWWWCKKKLECRGTSVFWT